jgi:hypothetical protein
MHRGFLWERQKGKEHYEGIEVGGRVILKYILGK